jgi:hypothetical protein
MEADRKSNREDLKGMVKEMMNANQAEMRSTVCAIQCELKETIQHEIRAVIQPIQSELDETTACNEVTETEPDSGMMQSIAENQVAPKEHATVETDKVLKKWHRGRKPAAEQHGEPKEMTRGDCGAGKMLAAACRKVSSCVTVAWQKKGTS